MRDRTCQARANSKEFGWGSCYNYAKGERYGLFVCRVHANMVDRLASRHGEEYALAVVWHEWNRCEALLPRIKREALPTDELVALALKESNHAQR